MVGIWDYPDIDSVEEEVTRAFDEVKGNLATEFPNRAELIDSFELEQVAILEEWGRGTAQKGQDPLNIMLYTSLRNRDQFVEEDVALSDSDVYGQLAQNYTERLQDEFQPDETMLEWFGGVVFGSIPNTEYEGSIVFFINQAQPTLAYNLTDRDILSITSQGEVEVITPGEPDESPVEEVEEPDEEDLPTDILQFPQKQELLANLGEAFNVSLEAIEDQQRDLGALEDIEVGEFVVVGEWGRGTGDFGEDPLSIIMSLTLPGDENPNDRLTFPQDSQELADMMEQGFQFTQLMSEWFSGINIASVADEFFTRSVETNLRGDAPQKAYNLTTNATLTLEEGELSIQQLQPEEEEEPEEEEPSLAEQLADEFPTVTPELRQFAVSDTQLEIPAGKDTKSVRARDPYPFEIELASPGPSDETREINEGIGEAIAAQRFGTEEPAATFPRTGIYVKWHLFSRGPSYINEIYNDLVVYSGYISSVHGALLKPGRYVSFREFMYRLNEAGKRGGPELVRTLSTQEAVQRGLDTQPTLPDGTEAPWLEPRQYYELNEENINHPAWNNITEYLYQILGEQEQ